MIIENHEQFQKKLIELVMPLILFSLESERKELREIIKNTLFDLEGPRHFASFSTRRDDIFASRLVLSFDEIVTSYLRLKDIEIYTKRFPYRNTGISALRYLKYHIESYFNEIYIFKLRLEAFLGFLEKRYRKSPITHDINFTTQKLKKIVLSALGSVITTRGAHVHEGRFSDRDLDRLSLLERLRASEGGTDILMILYESEYKKVRKKWAAQIQNYNNAIKKLFDTCCKGLYSVLFDEQGKLIFPDT